ncbi:MAG: SIMPL domain-containing protein [Treponema sp.]
MKRIFYCALASAALFLSCTIQKPAEKPRFITVTASAAVAENADYALVTFPVSTAGWVAVKVIEDNRAAAGRISEALQASGVGIDDITVSNYAFEAYRVDPRQYFAAQNVTAKVHNFYRIGDIIDAAKLPALPVPEVEFKLTDIEGAYRRARTSAVQKAQEKAALLSGAGGCKIGELLSLEELNAAGEDKVKADKNGTFTVISELRATYSIE